ncbi:MAG: hypothetical protein FIA95_02895 [Gemmatimonadetes bacterium]|nr:hypothetical protein [Gemmatimonadota bacterium]
MDRHRSAGFALPAAIGALVIVGLLVTAGFYMARQEVRIGVASQKGAEAFYLAEYGIAEVMDGWQAGVMASRPAWTDTVIRDTLSYGHYEVAVKRMSSRLYFLNSKGTITEGGRVLSGATRSAGLIVRLFTGEISPPAALTTRGPTYLKGTAEIHGEDMYPPGWASYCSNALTDMPGVVHGDTVMMEYDAPVPIVSCRTTGSGKTKVTTCDTVMGGSNLTGSPHMLQDSAMTDTTFTEFGEMDWEDLVAMADKDVTSLGTNINGTGPDSSGVGICRTSTLQNWGNPEHPGAACGDYFPIIYHAGPLLRIQSGGLGQGILRVDGDLDLRGNFIFNGVIIVQGNFETQGSGNRINGGVMASNAELEEQSLVGGSVGQYSKCAVERALLNYSSLTRARPLAQRSFVDLTNVIGP